jgi:hypothetical protein
MPIRITQPIGSSVGIRITAGHDESVMHPHSTLAQPGQKDLSTAGTYLEVPATQYAGSSPMTRGPHDQITR